MIENDALKMTLKIMADEVMSPAVIDRESLNLRKELQAAGVFGAKQASAGSSPAGSRGLDIVELGVLVVALAPAVPIIHKEGYTKPSLKKYKPIAARNEDKKVFSGLL